MKQFIFRLNNNKTTFTFAAVPNAKNEYKIGNVDLRGFYGSV